MTATMSGGESIVLEEEYDENYQPTEDEVLEYAQWLGMDPVADADLMWIAHEGLRAPLPAEWKPCMTQPTDGSEPSVYYFHFVTGESIWDHPCDQYYKGLFAAEKKKKADRQAGISASAPPSAPASAPPASAPHSSAPTSTPHSSAPMPASKPMTLAPLSGIGTGSRRLDPIGSLRRDPLPDRPTARLSMLPGSASLPSSISDATSSSDSLPGLAITATLPKREAEWRAQMEAEATNAAQLDAYKAKLDADLAAKKKALADQQAAELARLEATSADTLKEHYARLEAARKETAEKLAAEEAALAARLEAQSAELDAKLREELDAARAKAEAEAAERTAALATQAKLARLEHDQELARLKTKWANEQAEQRMAELERLAAEKQAAIAAEKERLASELKIEIAALETAAAKAGATAAELDALKADRDALAARLADVEASQSAASRTADADVAAITAERDALAAQLAAAKARAAVASSPARAPPGLAAELASVAAERDALAARLAEAERRAADNEPADAVAVSAERDALAAQVAASTAQIASLKSAYAVAEAQYGASSAELTKQLEELTAALGAARAEAAAAKHEQTMAKLRFEEGEGRLKAELAALAGELEVARAVAGREKTTSDGTSAEAARTVATLNARIASLEAELELARQAEARRRDDVLEGKRASLLYQSNLRSQIASLAAPQTADSATQFEHYMSHGFHDSDSEEAAQARPAVVAGVGESDGESAGEMLRDELETLEAAVAEERARLANVKAEVKAQNAVLKRKASWLESQRAAWREDAAATGGRGADGAVLSEVKATLEGLAADLNRDAQYVKASKEWVKLSEAQVELMGSQLDESRSAIGGDGDLDMSVADDLVRVADQVQALAAVLKRGAPSAPASAPTPARRQRGRVVRRSPLRLQTPGGSTLELKWVSRLDSALGAASADRARLSSFLRGVGGWTEKATGVAVALAKHACWLDKMKEVVRAEERAHSRQRRPKYV